MDYEKIKISDQEKYLAFTPLELLEIKTMTDEIMASSEIEGKKLNRIEVENSVMRKILFRSKRQKGLYDEK